MEVFPTLCYAPNFTRCIFLHRASGSLTDRIPMRVHVGGNMGKKRGRRPSPRRVKIAGVFREDEGGLPAPLDDQRGPVARRASVLVETGQEV